MLNAKASMNSYLEFEKPLAELNKQIAALRDSATGDGVDIGPEVEKLEAKSAAQLLALYKSLTPWQKTLVARHPDRPHFKQLVAAMVDDFMPLAGDRGFADDQAILGGLGRIDGRRVMVIGHEKGHDTATRIRHNFGMGKPEGYRKAIRLMQLADRFGIPVVTLVDTSGAFPGIEAEERGQAEAIARSTEQCLALGVPMIAAVVGEGGSGGAIALATADRVLMYEHAVYAVISPEGCASILWRTSDKASDAAAAMRVTAQDLLALKVIDEIVPEPIGGAHRDPAVAIAALKAAIGRNLSELGTAAPDARRLAREEKFLAIGRL
jgi:acetyl-CoA carboxylase carboxyl transferase subunit alpha